MTKGIGYNTQKQLVAIIFLRVREVIIQIEKRIKELCRGVERRERRVLRLFESLVIFCPCQISVHALNEL